MHMWCDLLGFLITECSTGLGMMLKDLQTKPKKINYNVNMVCFWHNLQFDSYSNRKTRNTETLFRHPYDVSYILTVNVFYSAVYK